MFHLLLYCLNINKCAEEDTKQQSINYKFTLYIESFYSSNNRSSDHQILIMLQYIRKGLPKKFTCNVIFLSVLLAEIVAHYFPKIVELHNYSPAAATKQKMENWYLLNR